MSLPILGLAAGAPTTRIYLAIEPVEIRKQTARHSRSTKTLSRHRPLPSIDSFRPAASSGWGNSAQVNWQPWAVLKIWGVPYRAIPRCTAFRSPPQTR